jgi:hypothetical protein
MSMSMSGSSGFNGSSTRGSSSIRPSCGSADSSTSSDRRASSEYGRAAHYLSSRGIFAEETEYVHDFDSPEACRGMYQAFFDVLLAPDAHGAVAHHFPLCEATALLGVVDRSSSSTDIKLNEDLFAAVGLAIQGLAAEAKDQFKFRPPVLGSDNLIVLEPKERLVIGDTEYAAGLARGKALPNMNRKTDLVDDDDDDDDNDDDAPRVHAAVVLRRAADRRRRRDDGWEVWNVLAVVELDVHGRGVRDLAQNHGGNVDHMRLFPLAARAHGPLAHAIMSTAAHALIGTAALGWKVPELKVIPFAVVSSCQTNKTSGGGGDTKAARKGSRWVHGNLVVPEVCGFPYAFNVDAYGNPVEGQEQGNHSSLAAYLHVMAHGLTLASEWIKHASEAKPPLRNLPAPHCMSGRSLHFGTDTPLTRDGTNEATLVLVASPVSKYGKYGLRISQGELFKTTINLQKLRSSMSTRDDAFWCCDTYDDEETSVLVKVTSMSCFVLLVPSGRAYLYGIEDDVWKLRKGVRDVLSKSLYGFYVTPGKHGLVQLLPNLIEQGYGELRPKDWLFEDTWSAVWDAFAQFVAGTLLPLAKYEILHTDLRAGYDVTSNVLYNPTCGGSMRMIDLDSLCSLWYLCGMSSTRDKRNFNPRYLPAKMRDSALGFLLAQVMCVSEAWLGGIRDADVNATDIITEAAHSIEDVKGAATVDEGLIAKVLAHYRRTMAEKYGSRRRRPPGVAAAVP